MLLGRPLRLVLSLDPLSMALVIGGNHGCNAPRYFRRRLQLQAMTASLGRKGGTGCAADAFHARVAMFSILLYSTRQPDAKEPQTFCDELEVRTVYFANCCVLCPAHIILRASRGSTTHAQACKCKG